MTNSTPKPVSPAISSVSSTMIPSKEVNSQDACPLFKLAVELRNEIYPLVFTVETNEEDGSIELNESTAAPSKALVMTCQVIRSETRAMYKAAYRNYPKHTFTLAVPDCCCTYIPFVPALSNDLFVHMRTFRLEGQNDDHVVENPFPFTIHFDRTEPEQSWSARVELRDAYWRGITFRSTLIKRYRRQALAASAWRALRVQGSL